MRSGQRNSQTPLVTYYPTCLFWTQGGMALATPTQRRLAGSGTNFDFLRAAVAFPYLTQEVINYDCRRMDADADEEIEDVDVCAFLHCCVYYIVQICRKTRGLGCVTRALARARDSHNLRIFLHFCASTKNAFSKESIFSPYFVSRKRRIAPLSVGNGSRNPTTPHWEFY